MALDMMVGIFVGEETMSLSCQGVSHVDTKAWVKWCFMVLTPVVIPPSLSGPEAHQWLCYYPVHFDFLWNRCPGWCGHTKTNCAKWIQGMLLWACLLAFGRGSFSLTPALYGMTCPHNGNVVSALERAGLLRGFRVRMLFDSIILVGWFIS